MGFVEQFKDEARLAATFAHANIVTTFDFGEADGNYYIAMEYVEGKNLRRIVDSLEKRGKRLPEAAAVHIIAEACRGLDYAHQRRDNTGRVLGIVHRDVSPQNLVVSYSGDVKVLDFGIAKSAARDYHTAAGIVKGKLRYMAPEQVTGEPIDGRADLFAAAVVLWELLYGRRVMPDLPDTELVEWVQKGEFIRPPATEPDREIDVILAKALEVNPDHRYATCAEFATALNRHNITQWSHWTPSELGKLLQTEFSDDARREREWITHILGQMAPQVQVEVDVSVPASMKVLEAPSRDDIKTTSTPSGGVKRGAPTVLKPMEPDSGNTLSGFHVNANPRGANTEVSIPMIKGTPVEPVPATQLGATAMPAPPHMVVAVEPPPGRPWLMIGGVGAGVIAAGFAATFLLPALQGDPVEATPTVTPIAIATATPATSPAASPIASPVTTPVTTQVAVVTATPIATIPKATPYPTATTRRTPVPTATPAATSRPAASVAYLSVNVTSGWASVLVDDKLVARETPAQRIVVSAGTHVVTVMKGGKKRSETIVLRAGEQRTLLLDPP